MKKKIEQASQLPVHVYVVPENLSGFLKDQSALLTMMAAIKKDIEEDLDAFEIADRKTLRDYHINLSLIAILEGQLDEALPLLERVKDLEDKPAAKLLSGTLELSIIAAKRAPQDSARATFSKKYEEVIRALPYETVQAELKTRKGIYGVQSENLLLGYVDQQFGPAAKAGSVSSQIAVMLLAVYFTLAEILPRKEAIVEVLGKVIAEHAAEKPDIWGAREVTLDGTDSLTPVVVGIWDTGTDVSLFPGRLFIDRTVAKENDTLCDLIGDAHGIGWTWDGERNHGPLRKLDVDPAQLAQYKRYVKGSYDIQANVPSPEADELRKHLSALSKEEVKPFLEGVGLYGVYSHGTHVAGIAARGNPAIRILVARVDFNYELIRPAPTLEWAEHFGRMTRETIAYFKANGVRVVNMSWGFAPKILEKNLEVNNKGGNAEERRALALKIFDVMAKEFIAAIQEAPGILFVAAAGNTDSNVRFDQHLPSGFDFPNTMSAGAVDRAGDEAFFTCFGKVDVYANGYEVEGFLPGGEIQKFSGTSMSSPQVVNLAAKLFARFPRLTATQVRQLIIEGTDEKQAGQDRRIRLLNPKRSFEMAAKMA